MTISNRRWALAAATLTLICAAPAAAQDNFDAGKTGAQLFASDCAICHKSPQGLSKAGGVFGLDSFLREHYTASREAAARITAYLTGVDHAAAAAPASRTRSAKKPKNGQAGKSADVKTGEKNSKEAKASGAKTTEAKPADTKPAAGGASDKKE